MNRALTLWIILLLTSGISAQNPQWAWLNHYTANVTAEEGDVVWIGTYSGLVSYNQLNGAISHYNSFNSGLQGNTIYDIAIDKNGVKWIGTNEGLTSFDGSNWMTWNTTNSGLPQTSGNTVYRIAIDRNDVKWICTNTGLTSFDGTNWVNYNTLNSPLPSDYISTVKTDMNGVVWVGTTDNGIAAYDGTVWHIYNTTNSGLPTNIIHDIEIDNNNTKWIAGQEYLSKLSDTTWSVWNIEYNWDEDIACDSSGIVWIASTNHSLSSFDGANFTLHDTFPFESGNFINSVMVDRDGNKWVSTNRRLVKLNDLNWEIISFSNSVLPSGRIDVIETDGNTKWIGTPAGLVVFDGVTWTVYNKDNSSLPDNNILCIHIDKQKTKWIGTGDGMVAIRGDNWETYMSNYDVHSITSAPDGKIWIGYSCGLTIFDGLNWTNYSTFNSGLLDERIITMTADSSGSVWMSTPDNGYNPTGPPYDVPRLSSFDESEWTYYSSSISCLFNNRVLKLRTDKTGKIWMGTYKGLITFDGSEWMIYDTTNSPLESVIVKDIALTDSLAWIASINYGGLASFDGTNWQIYDFHQLSPLSIATDTDGTVWIGTQDGLIAYNPDGLTLSKPEPKQLPVETLRVYPNPGNSTVTLETPGKGTLFVMNMNGEIVSQTTVSTKSTPIDVSRLMPGVYIMRFVSGDRVRIAKFLRK